MQGVSTYTVPTVQGRQLTAGPAAAAAAAAAAAEAAAAAAVAAGSPKVHS